jgi:predicted MFS family arabinose efflux permease
VAIFIDIALAAGAFFLGIVAEVFDYRAVFAVGAVSALLGLLLLLRIGVTRSPAPFEVAEDPL